MHLSVYVMLFFLPFLLNLIKSGPLCCLVKSLTYLLLVQEHHPTLLQASTEQVVYTHVCVLFKYVSGFTSTLQKPTVGYLIMSPPHKKKEKKSRYARRHTHMHTHTRMHIQQLILTQPLLKGVGTFSMWFEWLSSAIVKCEKISQTCCMQRHNWLK